MPLPCKHMPFPAQPVNWEDPSTFYTGSDELVELADVHIKHSGLLLPAHSQVLATQSAVLRSLFRSLREDTGSPGGSGAAMELETPFSGHSLQAVVFLLRMFYHSQDATAASLDAVAEHAEGIIRLAHALDMAGPLMPAAEAFVGARMERSAGSALHWMPVAEACGLQTAHARGIRTLARDLLGKTGGAAGAFAAVQQLSHARLSQDSTLAVLAAVAAGCCELSEADSKHAKIGREAQQRVPGPEVLAHWQEGGCRQGAFTWSVPRFSKLRASGQSPLHSPVFATEGRRWQLQLFPRGQGGGPPSLDLYLRSWDLACSSARRNESFAADFNLGLLNQDSGEWRVKELRGVFSARDGSWGVAMALQSELSREPGFTRDNTVVVRVHILSAARQ